MCIHSLWAWLHAYKSTKTHEYKPRRLPEDMVGAHVFLLETQSKNKRGGTGTGSRCMLVVEYAPPIDTRKITGVERHRICREEVGWSENYYLAYPVVRVRALRWGLNVAWSQFPRCLEGIGEGDARAALTSSLLPEGQIFEMASEIELRAELALFVDRKEKRAGALRRYAKKIKKEGQAQADKYLACWKRTHYIPSEVQIEFTRHTIGL